MQISVSHSLLLNFFESIVSLSMPQFMCTNKLILEFCARNVSNSMQKVISNYVQKSLQILCKMTYLAMCFFPNMQSSTLISMQTSLIFVHIF